MKSTRIRHDERERKKEKEFLIHPSLNRALSLSYTRYGAVRFTGHVLVVVVFSFSLSRFQSVNNRLHIAIFRYSVGRQEEEEIKTSAHTLARPTRRSHAH